MVTFYECSEVWRCILNFRSVESSHCSLQVQIDVVECLLKIHAGDARDEIRVGIISETAKTNHVLICV